MIAAFGHFIGIPSQGDILILCVFPKDSTIEDLLPNEFVKSFFDSELEITLNLNNDKPILPQIKKQHGNINKERLNSLKIKLSKKFIEVYASKQKIENEAPKIVEFTKLLISKLQNGI